MIYKLHQKLKDLNNNCYVNNIFYYNKTNLIRAPLEATLILYVAELYIIFTNYFICRSLETNEILTLIFFPLIFSVVLCSIYSFLVMKYIINRIHKHIFDIVKTNFDESPQEKYNKLNKIFKKHFIWIHTWGTICYSIVTGITVLCFLAKFNGSFAKDYIKSTVILTIFSLLSGFLWNLMGYWSDNTIEWGNIYKNITSMPSNQAKDKFKSYIYHRILNIIILLSIILFVLCALINIRNEFSKDVDLNIYYLFITIFITIVIFYAKQMYRLFFNEKDCEKTVFLNLMSFMPHELDVYKNHNVIRKINATNTNTFSAQINDIHFNKFEMIKLLLDEWKNRISTYWSITIKIIILDLLIIFLPYIHRIWHLNLEEKTLNTLLFSPMLGIVISIMVCYFSTIEMTEINRIKENIERIIMYDPLFKDVYKKTKLYIFNDYLPIFICAIEIAFAIIVIILIKVAPPVASN